MSKERIRTTPNLADTSPAHQTAIAAGNDHYRMWLRNVEDRFKDKSEETIKKELAATAFPFAVCCENLIGDYNIASIFRCCNVFNAKEIFYIGDKKFDRRSLHGCHNYMNITWLPTINDFIKLSAKYSIVGCDNVNDAVPLSTYNFVPDTMFVFGSEGVGLSPAMRKMCKELIYIEQHGSIRSLNVGVASGIIMNAFVSSL